MCNSRERKQEMIKQEMTPVMETRETTNTCPLSVEEPEENGHVTFTVYGNFDRKIIPDIFDGITPLFTKQRSRVTMNLEGVTGIDNSGIATIVECVRMASDSETEFNVIGINEKVKEVLELTKLSSLFENMEFRTVCSNSESGTLGCCIKKKINIPNRIPETN